MPRGMDRCLPIAVVFAALAFVPGTGAAAGSEHPPVVISQVYGGGGNVGATYTHDFVELFNRGAETVSLADWSVQYATANGSFWTVTPLNGALAPGGRHLVQQAGGSGGTVPLPTPDTVGSVQMAAASGKVALVAGTGILPCGSSCADAEWVVDFVGYGSANDFEGTGPTPTLSNTLAAIRAGDGCTDTDDNRADFSAGPPDPRNSAAEPTPCSSPDPEPTPDPSPDPVPSPDPNPEPTPDPEPSPDPSPDPGCEDATPPTLEATATPATLWPPNHRRVQVDVQVTVSDESDPSPSFHLVSATSSEPDTGMGAGDRPDDVVVMDDRTVLLRAERFGGGPGRVYALTYAAIDACGNGSAATVEVTVPHDRGQG